MVSAHYIWKGCVKNHIIYLLLSYLLYLESYHCESDRLFIKGVHLSNVQLLFLSRLQWIDISLDFGLYIGQWSTFCPDFQSTQT